MSAPPKNDSDHEPGPGAVWLARALLTLGRLPDGVRYALARFIVLLAADVLRYRRRVVRENLERALPEFDEANRRQIERETYRRMGEAIAEVLACVHMSEAELRERVELVPSPEIEAHLRAGRSVILLGAHQYNWEWGALRAAAEFGVPVVALVKTLHVELGNHMVRRLRERFGQRSLPIQSASRALVRERNVPKIIGMLADQRPRRTGEHAVFQWLGRESEFHIGPERLARAFGWPVCFLNIQRISRGRYRAWAQALEPAPSAGEWPLTEAYARAVEAQIRRDPAGWLWTHQRWRAKKKQKQQNKPASASP
ncbi:MAG: lysophospholipid acyltransferase family protein [Chromatiales bacterium]|nr:lysophospholipid acyltransferase family protein [Chromatiales bacterium]